MARYIYQGTFKDGNGARIDAATVSAFLAGTTTAADVYTASSGGTAVNSVTTDSRGSFSLWVDDTDYNQDQLFKITMSKANFESSTYDDIAVFPKNRMILNGEQNFFIDGRTNVRLITLGAERQEHTAGIAGTRAKHIAVKPAGFDDTSAIVIVQDLDGSSTDIRAKGVNFNADVTGATNAHVNALEVSKVGDLGSGMIMDAVDVRGGIGVIDHHSGATAAADTAFKFDDSGSSWTDVTVAFGSAGTDVTIFDEDNDLIYIGDAAQFNTIEVILATVASNPGTKPTFEYSQGASSWNTLPVSDDTNGFRENGNIFYSIPGDWATDTVNAVASKYWVRIKRTTNSLSTIPIEDTIKIVSSIDYTWDKDGDLIVNNITGNNITSGGTIFITDLQINDTSADHQYILAVSDLAADRTVTLPLLTGNDEFVFKDFAQTLTNKTLTAPIIGDASNIVSATTSVEGVVELATDAEVKTGTDTARPAPVSALGAHDAMIKCWVNFDGTGTPSIQDSYNITGVTDPGVGDYRVLFDTDFADTNYVLVGSAGESSDRIVTFPSGNKLVGSCQVIVYDVGAAANADDANISVIAIGNQ
jgi:hypothetical protein